MAITVRIPMPSSMLIVNLLGLFGLIGLSVAVGGLTGNWWWSLAVASVFAVGLSVVAATHAAVQEQSAVPVVPSQIPRAV